MNLDRYEKIDGREALRRLVDGQRVYDNYGWYWEMSEDGIVSYVKDEKKFLSEIHLATFSTHKYLYIPKPFDVRQAMIERPNKWVGAYNDGVGWWAVGFDLDHCCVVSKQIPISYPVDAEYAGTDFPKPEQLNICIPIEDVPEEATR